MAKFANQLFLSLILVLVAALRGVSQDVEVATSAKVDQSFVGGNVTLEITKPNSRASVKFEGKVSRVNGKVAIVEKPKMVVTRVRGFPVVSKIPYLRTYFENALEPTTEIMAGNLILVSPTH